MSLPGPTIEVPHWRRAAALAAALPGSRAADRGDATALPAAVAAALPAIDNSHVNCDVGSLRARVGAILNALAWRIDEGLPAALASAPQAWDRVDHLLTFFDPPLISHIGEVRRALEAAAASPPAAAHGDGDPGLPGTTGITGGGVAARRATGIEGLLVLEAACGLARLCEQRLSSLIRLRVRSGDEQLLPGGRPFLDVAAALKEAARAWA